MTFDLHESVNLSEGGKPRVDREAGVIRGVRVLGWASRRGYSYRPQGVDPALYEGKAVCFDHIAPGKERSAKDTVGWLENVARGEAGLYADLRLAHPAGDAEQRLLSLAEHNPKLVALSHSARAGAWGQGGKVVESVAEVDTVDLVRRGATNSGLYEGGTVARSVKDLIEGLKATRPGYARGLQEAAQAGVMGADTAMDPPPDAGPAPDEAIDHEQALLDAAAAVLKDEGLSSADKLSKIKAILKIVDGGASASTGDEKPAEESLRAVAKLNLLEAANAAGVRVAPSLLESVRPDLTPEGAKKLVAEFGTPAGAGGKPGARSAPPPAPAAAGKKPGDGGAVQEGVPAGLDAKGKARWAREGV